MVFKTHLDVGFTDYAEKVERIYLEKFIPGAVALGREMAARRGQGFVWTTGSWLVRRALDSYSGKRLKEFEDAIARGFVAWHALPFTVHSELMDPALFDFGLSISKDLDRRFGKKTIAAKMTDVPGHTIGIVPRLAAAGVAFLHLGSNPGSTPPAVPELFTWRNPADGSAVTVMYHKGGYGTVFARPGLKTALCVSFTEDNLGPPSPERIETVFRDTAARVPGAMLKASTFNAFARALAREKPDLPVVEQELGDTWIHGAGTAPAKTRRFRELCRLRNQWLESGIPARYARKFFSFSENLLLVAEHTWGLDVKTHLADERAFAERQIAPARKTPPFRRMERSWIEQEQYIEKAVAALGGAPFEREARARLAESEPRALDMRGFSRRNLDDLRFETQTLAIAFDPRTGALCHFKDKAAGRKWAGPGHLLGVASFQNYGSDEVARYLKQYGFVKKNPPKWFARDFGKPGLEARSGEFHYAPMSAHVMEDPGEGLRVLLKLERPAGTAALPGAPRAVSALWSFPAQGARAVLDLQWTGKPASRIPEAAWLHFRPRTCRAGQWQLHKMGQWIDPLGVIANGNRRLHAVQSGVRYREPGGGGFSIQTLDAPLAAPGAPSLYDFNNRQPPLTRGMHFNLWNNAWGTNFPQWTDADARFRFVIECGETSC